MKVIMYSVITIMVIISYFEILPVAENEAFLLNGTLPQPLNWVFC